MKDPIQTLLDVEKNYEGTGSKTIFDSYFTPAMVDYMNDNLKDPKRKEEYLRARKRYEKLAANESDPFRALYYEYRMFLPHQQAMWLADKLYASEYNAGAYFNGIEDLDAEGGVDPTLKSIGVSDNTLDSKLFDSIGKLAENPHKMLEVKDFFEKLFKMKISEKAKILLCAQVMMGTGPGLRKKANMRSPGGLDLEVIMTKVPPEWNQVLEQSKELEREGIDFNHQSVNSIIFGANPDETKSGERIPRLLGVRDKPIAEKELQDAVLKLTGEDSYEKAVQWMFTLGECLMKPKSPLLTLQEANNKAEVLKVLRDYLSGKSVKASKLIKLIVAAVSTNLIYQTKLSKGKSFQGSLKDIAKRYMDLAKSGTESDIIKVQTMIMAPALDRLVRAKLK